MFIKVIIRGPMYGIGSYILFIYFRVLSRMAHKINRGENFDNLQHRNEASDSGSYSRTSVLASAGDFTYAGSPLFVRSCTFEREIDRPGLVRNRSEPNLSRCTASLALGYENFVPCFKTKHKVWSNSAVDEGTLTKKMMVLALQNQEPSEESTPKASQSLNSACSSSKQQNIPEPVDNGNIPTKGFDLVHNIPTNCNLFPNLMEPPGPIENDEWLVFLQRSMEEVMEGDIESMLLPSFVDVVVGPLRNPHASCRVIEYIASLLSLPFAKDDVSREETDSLRKVRKLVCICSESSLSKS